MKKLDIIQELGKNLRRESVNLTELCILLALYQGDRTSTDIKDRTQLDAVTINSHIGSLLRHDNITCTVLRRGNNPGSYEITESGYYLLLQCIPADNAAKLKNGNKKPC